MCVPAGCPVRTDGRRGYVNTSACLGHCVSSFFSPLTCFHSASADDLGSNLFNFVCWLHNLLDLFFFLRSWFVVCILGFVRPIFLVPICCAHFLFHRSSLCRAQNCVHCHFSKFDTSMWPCTVDRFDAYLERCCVEHTASWTCRCFVLDVVRCFWGSPLACGGVGHPREPRSRRKMSVHAVSDTCCVTAALELQVSTDSQSNFFFLRRCEPWRTCAITASRARRNRHLSIMLCHGVQCDDLVEAKSTVGMRCGDCCTSVGGETTRNC